MLWVDSDDSADEGVATPTHTEIALDTRIADALEKLHADVTWDSRKLAWTVFRVDTEGYPDHCYGEPEESRRDVLVRWLLQEAK